MARALRLHPIVPGLWRVVHRFVNAYVLEGPTGLTLVDTGTPDFASRLLPALPSDKPVHDIVVTHAHYDHAGSAAEIAKATGAVVWMHPADAELAVVGEWRRPTTASPTLLGRLLYPLLSFAYPDRMAPVADIRPIVSRSIVTAAGCLQVDAMPGHSAGQIAVSWVAPDGSRVLFAGDTVMNLRGLSEPLLYETRADGLDSIERLAGLAVAADVMAFGHGPPLFNPVNALAAFLRRDRR